MSGGSMNYLYRCREDGIDRLVSDDGLESLYACVDIVREAEKAYGVSSATFVELVDEIDKMAMLLQGFANKYSSLLHACEWKLSGDCDLKDVVIALTEIEAQS